MNKTIIIGLAVVVAVIAIIALMGDGKTENQAATDAATQQRMAQEAEQKAATDRAQMEEKQRQEQANAPQKQQGVMVGGAMMVPNLDIVDNAAKASNVSTVVAAVKAAGLVETLKGPGPFTVFAPNNAAFTALPAGTVDKLLLPASKTDLANILKYHVVSGRYTSADLKNGMELTTVQGKKLTIGNTNGVITINGKAKVETADVISSNGVTFVIDSVLMPPTQ